MGAKLRNVHRMGGERVKEMDHFVASIETPVLQVKIPDIAEFVVSGACNGAQPVRIADPAGDFDLFVQAHLRDPQGSVSADVAAAARAFTRMLGVICTRLLAVPLNQFRLYYMVTIRADACVCQRSSTDNLIYLNIMAFQQQAAHDPSTLEITGGVRVWRYWLQRIAMVVTPPGTPTGLYDPAIRQRYRAFVSTLPPTTTLQRLEIAS
eukprot:m.21761 g.21761  ORF g.21761 m.21761 type:complete len:208 (-) comp3664_c0_seq1:156-779(-)